METGTPDLQYDVSDFIARITLNRPDKGNAFTPGMKTAMRAVWSDIRENSDVRVVIVTAAGEKHFCTGADVSAIAESGRVNSGTGPLRDELIWSPYFEGVWKPVITAVNGLVAGGGLHLVVDADIVIASENAVFLDTHVNVGMVGGIENVGLARRLPLGTALRMTLQGRNFRLSAQRAYELGLVDEVVPTAELLPAAEEIARDIAANSPTAVMASKRAVWGALEHSYSDAAERGWRLVREHWEHPDFVEGPRAFADRRTPEWTDPPGP